MEWQPIETAPKDGRPLILYRPQTEPGWWDTVVLARWVDEFEGESIAAWAWARDQRDIFDEQYFSSVIASDQNYESNAFTHWMPLPEPPE